MTILIIVPLDLILKAATGLGVRVTEEVEEAGIDISEHGESMVAQPPQVHFDGSNKVADSTVVVSTNEAP